MPDAQLDSQQLARLEKELKILKIELEGLEEESACNDEARAKTWNERLVLKEQERSGLKVDQEELDGLQADLSFMNTQKKRLAKAIQDTEKMIARVGKKIEELLHEDPAKQQTRRRRLVMALRDHEKEIERLVLKKAKNEPRLSALIGTDDGRKKEASISDLLLRTPRHDYDFDDKHGVAYCVTSLWFSGQGEYKFLTILNNELLKTKCISHPSSPITKKKNA